MTRKNIGRAQGAVFYDMSVHADLADLAGVDNQGKLFADGFE